VAGQQYYIKVTTLTAPGDCVLSGNGNLIMDATGISNLIVRLVLGQAITLVWSSLSSVWMIMTNTAVSGDLSVTSVTTSAAITANGAIQANGGLTSTGTLSGVRLATSGGRQMRMTKYTKDQTLSLDDHFVSVSNTTGAAITISLPTTNPTPVDGQQYYIKATNITNAVIVSAYPGQIMANNGVSYNTYSLSLGETIFLVWSAAEGKWLGINASAGNFNILSLTTNGPISATGLSGTITASGLITASGGLKTTGRALGYKYIPPSTYASASFQLTNSDNIIVINIAVGGVMYTLPDNPIDGQEHMFKIISATFVPSNSGISLSGVAKSVGAKFLASDGLNNIGATSTSYTLPYARGHVRIMWMEATKHWVILEHITRTPSIPGSGYTLGASDPPIAIMY